MKTLFLVFILPFSLSYAQIKTEKKTTLLHTFRFIQEQQNTITNIKNKFPQLSIEANIAELEFNKNYSQALNNIHIEARKEVGSNFEKYLISIINESNQDFISKNMSEKEAFFYIKKVKNRAKGSIQSTHLEVFKKYGVLENVTTDLLTYKN